MTIWKRAKAYDIEQHARSIMPRRGKIRSKAFRAAITGHASVVDFPFVNCHSAAENADINKVFKSMRVNYSTFSPVESLMFNYMEEVVEWP